MMRCLSDEWKILVKLLKRLVAEIEAKTDFRGL